VKTERDPLMTENQAAELLGVKPSTLQFWRSNKRYPLEYVKMGRLVRYRLSALEEFISLRTVTQ
jgi:excisionase family DNA binding protein